MDPEKKICPYCGEEIMAAAKKCRHCGEWLTPNTQNTPTSIKTSLEEHQAKTEPVKFEINKALTYTIMVIVSLISMYNLVFEANHIGEAYGPSFFRPLILTAIVIIIAAIILTVVNVSKNKFILPCLRLWIAIEIICLCAPIEMIIQINHIGVYYDYLISTLETTTVLGLLCFFLTKYLSTKVIVNIYNIGSLLYAVTVISIFIAFKF